MSQTPTLSIVVPVYNEATNIRPLHAAVTAELDKLRLPYEIIFVNDGSRDDSKAVVRAVCAEDERVKLVSLSRNFGHQLAVTAGVEHACGQAVICMDADLQHPPELIPQMVAQWREGAQVVYTIREDARDASWFKRFTSSMFYRLINAISDVPIIPGAADFRLLDRQVADSLVAMRERSRFLRGMVSWVGFRQVGLHYTANPRFSGESKYSLRKMLALAGQGITSFSSLPLRVSAYLGFIASVAGVPYAIWAIYAKFFTNLVVPGWTSLLVAVLFLGGVQLMSMGIIGEYVGRIYTEVKGRPLYVAEETLGFEEADRLSDPATRPVAAQLQGPHFLRHPARDGQTTHPECR
jgi:polyisoprenyl-phosphate glycosyltransferase